MHSVHSKFPRILSLGMYIRWKRYSEGINESLEYWHPLMSLHRNLNPRSEPLVYPLSLPCCIISSIFTNLSKRKSCLNWHRTPRERSKNHYRPQNHLKLLQSRVSSCFIFEPFETSHLSTQLPYQIATPDYLSCKGGIEFSDGIQFELRTNGRLSTFSRTTLRRGLFSGPVPFDRFTFSALKNLPVGDQASIVHRRFSARNLLALMFLCLRYRSISCWNSREIDATPKLR